MSDVRNDDQFGAIEDSDYWRPIAEANAARREKLGRYPEGTPASHIQEGRDMPDAHRPRPSPGAEVDMTGTFLDRRLNAMPVQRGRQNPALQFSREMRVQSQL